MLSASLMWYINTTALELYNRLGFQVTDEDEVEEKEGRTYHTT